MVGFTNRAGARKGRGALLAVAAAGLALAGAASAQAQTIALVTINQQALFFNQINDGAREAADAAGAELVVFNANNDPAAQNNAMETYVSQGVDAIVIVAIDVNGIKPAVTTASEAGIPVIAIDARIPDGDNDQFIGVDNYGAGQTIGTYVAGYADGASGGEASVGIVGALNSYIQNLRRDGFVDALESTGLPVEIVDTVDGQNVQDIALTAAENLMTANPDMDYIYATGEPALLGAIAAVEAQGATDRVEVFGWDLTAQAVAAIDEGWVPAVVQQDPYAEGKLAVENALAMIAGEPVPSEITVPVTIVTPGNVDDFRGLFALRCGGAAVLCAVILRAAIPRRDSAPASLRPRSVRSDTPNPSADPAPDASR